MISFATIQFADRHSESIKNKNLLEIDGKPLWRYNAEEAYKVRKESGGDKPYFVRGNYICTNYDESELPAEGLELAERIPNYAFNTDKCLLADRVRDATFYLNQSTGGKYVRDYDAYVLLLGNVRSVPGVIDKCLRAWCDINRWTDYTGMLTVTNYSMFNPNRAMSVGRGGTAELVHGKEKCWTPASGLCTSVIWSVGEEKQASEDCSWFFDGGVMIMRADNKTDYRYDFAPLDLPTQFPFLGDSVFAIRQQPLDSIELDARWQIPLLMNKYRTDEFSQPLYE